MRDIAKTGLVFLSSLLLSAPLYAAPSRIAPEVVGSAPALDNETKQRIDLLEKKVDNNVIYEVLEQLNQLRQEISELREFAEQQEHKMDLLTKRQRTLYQDIDRRMLELEAGSSRSSGISNYPKSTTSQSSGIPGRNGVTPDGSNTTVSMKDDPGQEQAAYTRAFKLLADGNYTTAIKAFKEFLQNHSGGKFADNAQYWLGEANYAIRDYKTALVEFQKILSNYPDSPKRKDAELKIGFTYYELKDWEAAKRSLQVVITNFPETTNARTAKQRLDRMAREGR